MSLQNTELVSPQDGGAPPDATSVAATACSIGPEVAARLADATDLHSPAVRRALEELADCDAEGDCLAEHVAGWVLGLAVEAGRTSTPFEGFVSALIEHLGPEVMTQWEDTALRRERERGEDAGTRMQAEIDAAARSLAHQGAIRELASPKAVQMQRLLTREYRRTLALGAKVDEEDADG